MNPIKTGSFIKELRKEKGLTQEQLAEKFNVSRRTVSRWETGRNLPDLDILIEIADDFSVDLRELLDGERRSEKMNKELEETVLKAGDPVGDDDCRHHYHQQAHRKNTRVQIQASATNKGPSAAHRLDPRPGSCPRRGKRSAGRRILLPADFAPCSIMGIR